MVISLNKSTSIVFIDSKVDDYSSLIPGIASEIKIVLLDSVSDGLEKITATLQTSEYKEVHLISHGSPGCLYLGNNQLSLDILSEYTEVLKTWFSRNSEPPTLLLYGCNVAAGDAGAEFIAKLKQLTGAEIAATAKLTGNKALGGDWQLERTTTEMDVTLAVDELTRLTYQGVLATFNVTTEEDQDGEDTEGTDLALREAINAANNTAGSDVITFDSNVSNIDLTIGELKITDSVTIKGLGADSLAVDGGHQNFPVFSIGDEDVNAGINVDIDGLKITGGNNGESGGGISNLENLNLSNSVVSGNTSSKDGGGIFNYIGKTTIINSDISGNSADYGGGVSNYFGATEVTNSTISGNTANNDGGGVYNYVGALVVAGTEISDNFANVGGGVSNYTGATVVIGSTISGNTANTDGGGVYNYQGETNISYSNITNNSGDFGGGVASDSAESNTSISGSTISGNTANIGGGVSNYEGNVAITGSTISGNSASIKGGGVSNYFGATNITNSTISGNFAEDGGGVNNFNGETSILSSTISGNSANNGSGINNYYAQTALTSSIVAGNNNSQDVAGDFFASGGSNLIGNGDGTSFIDGVNGDLVGTADNPINPVLEELQDNGGLTETQQPLFGSPAIDASNNTSLPTDQRGFGFNRPGGKANDIGAFEVQNPLGSTGDDTLFGGGDDNQIKGLAGNDLILGEAGSDRLNGNNGDDIVNSGAGNDTVHGGADLDFLDGGKDNDQLFGDDGNDTVKGGAGNDTVRGDADDDIVSGGAGADSLFGGNGSDLINGDADDDIIRGGAGNDLIIGGEGSDTLVGGDGLDVFFLDSYQGGDLITDFMDGVDRFNLSSGLSFGSLNIVDNESYSAVIIQDTTNNNSVVAMIENVQAAAITSDDFTNL